MGTEPMEASLPLEGTAMADRLKQSILTVPAETYAGLQLGFLQFPVDLKKNIPV